MPQNVFIPIILLGAARSGTNMLRNALTGLPDVTTWPCDEINYIWRHGNARFPTDAFSREMARPEVVRTIRNAFISLANRTGKPKVVEKTCANTLRVPFVDEVVPEAHYIHLVRDPYDVAPSATLRWKAPLDIPYIMAKARYVPPLDMPFYATQYLLNRVAKVLRRDQRLSTWGPRYANQQEDLQQNPLVVAAALQWQHCVRACRSALQALAPDRFLEIRYEDFVQDPKAHFNRVLTFLNMRADEREIATAVAGVSAGSVGRGRDSLFPDHLNAIRSAVGDLRRELGYT